MNQPPMEHWEARLQQMADEFPYPPTPDVAVSVRLRLQETAARSELHRRQLAWAAVIALVILSGLLAVPQVRAAVFEILRVGAIRIVPATPAPTAPALTPTSAGPVATPNPSPTPLSTVLDLAGETTLADARARVSFPIRQPAYPSDLGSPDRVFLQDLGGQVIVLVWMDRTQPDRVRMSLHELGPGTFAEKIQPPVVQETTVNGQHAVWTLGPHLLQFSRNGQVIYDARRLVEGHTLVWTQGDITYRLETDLPLNDAVRIAESLGQ